MLVAGIQLTKLQPSLSSLLAILRSHLGWGFLMGLVLQLLPLHAAGE